MQQIIINKITNSKSQVNRIFGGIQQIKSMEKNKCNKISNKLHIPEATCKYNGVIENA